MSFYSPLRYPGGKGRLGCWMAQLMRTNGISGGWYAEPYCGGAGVALHLLLDRYVRRIFINDIDPAIFAFWDSLLRFPGEVIERVRTVPLTIDEWDRQKAVLATPSSADQIDLGFAAFFVNRTSRSGILSGGAIGGRNQAGKWKLDARFHRENLAKRINLIAQHASRIVVTNLDAMDFLDALTAEGQGLVYLDPPYLEKAGNLYENSYSKDDHLNVAKRIQKLQGPWVVTYDDSEEISGYYDWAEGGRFEIYYTANHRSSRLATELIFHGGLNTFIEPFSKR